MGSRDIAPSRGPAAARVIATWFPSSERGMAGALFNCGQYLSLGVFMPLMGYVAYHFGWAQVFTVMGGLGLLVALVWGTLFHVPAALLKDIGVNTELAETDWGTVLQRRVNREAVEKGGWSIFHTWFPAISLSNPAASTILRGQGAIGWFGWYSDATTEAQVAQWLNAETAQEQDRLAAVIQDRAFANVPTVSLGQFSIRTAYRNCWRAAPTSHYPGAPRAQQSQHHGALYPGRHQHHPRYRQPARPPAARGRAAARRCSAATPSNAATAGWSAAPTTPASTGTVRSARAWHGPNGSKPEAELLPVPYFHVVFTLPPMAAEIAFQNRRILYAILFHAAAEALRDIAADPRHLGADRCGGGAAYLG